MAITAGCFFMPAMAMAKQRASHPPAYLQSSFDAFLREIRRNDVNAQFSTLKCHHGGRDAASSSFDTVCIASAQNGKIQLTLMGSEHQSKRLVLTGTLWSHKSGTQGRTKRMDGPEITAFQSVQHIFVRRFAFYVCGGDERYPKFVDALLSAWSTTDVLNHGNPKPDREVIEECGSGWGRRNLTHLPPKDPSLHDSIILQYYSGKEKSLHDCQ